jgi:cytochrome c peroxidase
VACFDCHVNGHTNGATHLVGDIRPQSFRHRLDTPTLRGAHIERLFGSQRALRSIEDFTEFEQRAAYFDGDPVTATKKGVNPLDRGTQVHFMAEVQELFDFPPAPKLLWDGRLDPALATAEERRGEEVFFGKGRCAGCHVPPYFTETSCTTCARSGSTSSRPAARDQGVAAVSPRRPLRTRLKNSTVSSRVRRRVL